LILNKSKRKLTKNLSRGLLESSIRLGRLETNLRTKSLRTGETEENRILNKSIIKTSVS